MTYAEAKRLADQLLAELSPVCERIEIAGGVRREKPEPHDIELVAIPKMEPIKDLFGEWGRSRNLLNEYIISHGYFVDRGGDRFKKIVLTPEISCDLFIVLPPFRQWGVLFTLRTGPEKFSHRIVTPRKHGGYMPSDCRERDGAVWNKNNELIPMPEEIDFLNFLGLGWIEPKERR
jgi:DNA polymerase/3'-5' exonuclease PolX